MEIAIQIDILFIETIFSMSKLKFYIKQNENLNDVFISYFKREQI